MNWMRESLTKNVGMKLLSLALATALWAAFGSEPTVEAVFDVPVEFSSVPPSFELLAEQTRVQVRARGPSRAVRAARSQDFSIKIDLAGSSGAGERTYPLNRQSVQAPSEIEVLQTIPSRVRVSLEETAVKEIPVHPLFAGKALVRNFQLEPSQLKISGPRSHVDAISFATTDKIDLAGRSGPQTVVTIATVPDPRVRFVDYPAVTVTVEH